MASTDAIAQEALAEILATAPTYDDATWIAAIRHTLGRNLNHAEKVALEAKIAHAHALPDDTKKLLKLKIENHPPW
jgi:hypothetical protein